MAEEWKSVDHALGYLARADRVPHRTEGEGTVLEEISENAWRILDLGSGDGRLLNLVLLKCPNASGVALDFSPPMLEKLHERFGENDDVEIIEHDMQHPLPETLGQFDTVVSSFAIHHLEDQRKKELYREVWQILTPGGVFCNLEHVSSPTPALHRTFFECLGENVEEEDPSNKLLDVETQLQWFREIGFREVDCHWKWRELALLAGGK